MKFTIAQGSRRGPRKYNQDRVAYSYSKDALLAVLADGMGGHQYGELAAQIAIQTLTEAFQRTALPIIADPAKFLISHILAAHDAIGDHVARHNLLDQPRTTIVAAIAQQNELFVAHAGDSRLYHFREGHVIGKTEDHSKVQFLFRQGLIPLGKMGMHPERNKVYNCLGGAESPKVELSLRRDLRDGDTILLCSDGVWSLVGDEKMADILATDTVNIALPALLDLAESRADRKGDNMSAIAFNWGGVVSGKAVVSTAEMDFGAVTTIVMNPRLPDEAAEHAAAVEDFGDDEIEHAIAEIQAAIKKNPAPR
jgi:serine/threonine protein phosphatase PrpC